MSEIYLMYAFIAGVASVLATAYVWIIANLYMFYRKLGMTRKQAILSTWRMCDE